VTGRRRVGRRVIVVGCGRLGSVLAGRLGEAGREVVVIDREPDAFERLPREFSGIPLPGDATEPSVLREAGVEGAACLLAVTEDDTVNLLVAEVARTIFQVPRVLVRVFDPARERVYRDAGLETVSPTELAAAAFLAALEGAPGSAS
jgi:trk system potassium uptake protein TrkA